MFYFFNRFILLALISVGFTVAPLAVVRAETVDLSLEGNSISFSTSTLYAGDEIRIYARVRNVGDTDASAYVLFYQGGMLIGQTQAVSLRANGNPDDVYVDFTVPTGSFNIRAVLQGSSPQDQNPANDATQTALFSPIVDADRDGIEDETDNCVSTSNADQLDTDADDQGDECDSDDDNDGVLDVNDAYPLDALKSADPVPVIVAAPIQPSTQIVTTPSSSSVTREVTSADDSNAEETPTLATRTTTSKLTTSPLARFSWEQVDWRTYIFTLAEQPQDGVRFSWDFGDGATSVQSQITHAFSGPGIYTVTLAIIDDDGTTLSDAQTFDVTFFHLDNPQVVGILIFLFIALFAFGFALIKLRPSYDQSALHK